MPAHAFESTYLTTNGIRLHVVTAGPPDGQLVILLHGFPEYWRGWIKQIQPLADAGYRVVVPDQRGYNLSDKPAGVRSYRMEVLGLDIIGLMDALGREHCCLVGHDWGAAVAWGVGLTFPERVKRLGILNVPHPDVMARFVGRDLTQTLKSWYIAFFQIPGLPEWLLSRNKFSGLSNMLLRSSKPGTFTPTDLDEYRQAWSQTGALTAMINWYRAVARYRPTAPEDMRLSMPVLILWGTHDIALSQKMAQPSIDHCRSAKLVYFENATHWVHHEESDAVTKALLEFLA